MRRRLRHTRMRHPLRLCVRSLLLLILPVLVVPTLGHAQTSNRAGLVIVKGDGSVQTACVAFDEPTISGLALLERSGLDIAVQPAGSNATVCSIAGEGCAFPREACWCQCAGGGPCRYWQYWHRNGGAWQYAATGAPLYRVPPDGVDAWVWGESAGNSVTRPPEIAFDAICAVPVAEPTLVLIPPTEVPPPPTDVPPPTAVPPTVMPPPPTRPAATATQVPAVQATATRPAPSATQPPATQTSTTLPEATSVPPQPTATSTPLPTLSPTIEQTPAGAALADTATTIASPLPPTSTAVPSSTATTLPPTPLEQPAVHPSSITDYVLFGGTACVLLLALTVAWRRRR